MATKGAVLSCVNTSCIGLKAGERDERVDTGLEGAAGTEEEDVAAEAATPEEAAGATTALGTVPRAECVTAAAVDGVGRSGVEDCADTLGRFACGGGAPTAGVGCFGACFGVEAAGVPFPRWIDIIL
jgi:hypothetical protein